MSNKAYTRDFRLRVVALAAARGAPEASKFFGVDVRAVRVWQTEMAYDSDLELYAATALSELGVEIATGKRGAKLSTDAGILLDKVARYRRAKVEPVRMSAVRAHDLFIDWLFGDPVVGTLGLGMTEESLDGDDGALLCLNPELLQRANDEPGQPHRRTMLAWFSGRSEYGGVPIVAGDVLEWAKRETLALLEEHGSVHGLKAWMDAERAARDKALHEQLARNKVAGLIWRAKSELRRTEP